MLGEFEAWFLAGGGRLHPNVEIASNSTGFHLRARHGEELASGSCVVSCPHSLTLSWLNVSSQHDRLLQFDPEVPDQAVATHFFLIHQYMLKEKSFWWPYIQSLPQPDADDSFATPLWYNSDDMVWIRGTNLEHAADVRERTWHQEYEQGIRQINYEMDNIPPWLVTYGGQSEKCLLRI